MSTERALRAAIVGAGLMGRWHADAISRVGGTVAVIVDRDWPRACALAARHAGCRAVADFSAVTRDRAADVAHLCTPLETHEALVMQALQAGMHVLVEKPLAQTAAATAALLQRAETQGLLLCPVHQLLFQPGVLHAQQACHTIGPLLHIDFIACSAGADGRSPGEHDRLIADILPHPLSLLARMLPERLATVAWHVQHPMAGELRATGTDGTLSVSVLVSTHGRPTANMLRLIGRKGTLSVDLFHGFHVGLQVSERWAKSRMYKIAHPFLFAGGALYAATRNLVSRAVRREVAYPGLRELIQRFYRAVRQEAAPPISTREILDVATVRDHLISML